MFVVAALGRQPMASTTSASRQTWRLAAVMAVASGTVAPAQAQSPTTGVGRDASRQRERMDDSERRLNETLREQFNDASRNGWR